MFAENFCGQTGTCGEVTGLNFLEKCRFYWDRELCRGGKISRGVIMQTLSSPRRKKRWGRYKVRANMRQ